MKIYSVHSRPGSPLDKAIFVREGSSIGAFAFTVLWALWNRMWLVAAVLLALWAAIGSVGLNENILGLASFAISLIFGLEAQSLRAASLIRAGYTQIGLTHGRNIDEAELRFYLSHKTQIQPTPIPPKYTAPADTLGLFGNV